MFSIDTAKEVTEIIIIMIVLSLGILAILLAFIPPEVRQKIPFIAIISGFFGYSVISWLVSESGEVPWLIKFFPGVIACILILLLIHDFINIQFIWGFCIGLYTISLGGIIYQLTETQDVLLAVLAVLFVSVVAAPIIYWTFIPKKMRNNNFDNFQISLTMIGTIWIGIALGFILSRLFPLTQ